MDAVEQTQYIRAAYLQITQELYGKNFLMQLAAVHSMDPDWYDRQLQLAELLSAQAEAGMMDANPRRAVRYLCALSVCSREISERVGRDFRQVEAGLVR